MDITSVILPFLSDGTNKIRGMYFEGYFPSYHVCTCLWQTALIVSVSDSALIISSLSNINTYRQQYRPTGIDFHSTSQEIWQTKRDQLQQWVKYAQERIEIQAGTRIQCRVFHKPQCHFGVRWPSLMDARVPAPNKNVTPSHYRNTALRRTSEYSVKHSTQRAIVSQTGTWRIA